MNLGTGDRNQRIQRPKFAALIGYLHDRLIYQRRIRALAGAIIPLVPAGKLLDVGLGNGDLPRYLMTVRHDLNVVGLDVLIRVRGGVPAVQYGGGIFPFRDDSFDSVLIADTLHHVAGNAAILAECLRVSRGPVIIKDHFYKTPWDRFLLRMLDIGGNAAHGVESIYNYFTRETWEKTVNTIGAHEVFRVEEVSGQYPLPFQYLLGRKIQFVSKLISGPKAGPAE